MNNNNIYLELELFLDPAITDTDELKKHLEQKINEWNKMVSVSPKFKLRVAQAKKFINSGLTDLHKQADEARNKMLQKLRSQISELKLSGEIDEVGFKHLNNTFKCYFKENTIKKEAGVTQFEAPVCPPSLQCDKIISFNDMQTILDDLSIAKNGQYQNLYEFLELPASTDVKILYNKSKEESNKIVKIMAKTSDVDAQNRLSGKALNFFKDDKSKNNYDKALKRLPFDKLCDEKLKLRAIKKEITWKVYQMSLQETQALGFTPEEAEWLVYEFYCVTKKCPPPKPESESEPTSMSVSTPIPSPPIGQSISLTSTGNFLKNVTEYVQNTGTQITKNVSQKIQEVIQSIPKSPEPLTNNKTETTFSPDTDTILKEFHIIRKRYQSSKSHSDTTLRAMFNALDSLVTQQQIKQTAVLPEMIELRAKIAATLADSEYKAEHFDFALQYYNAVLEYDPRNKIARQRQKIIDDTKNDAYSKIETLIASGNIIDVDPIIEDLQFKFETDFETIDFLRKTEDRLKNFKPSKEQLQKLINEKKWKTMIHLLESQPHLDSFYQDVLQKSKHRMEQVENAVTEIRKTIQQQNWILANQQLDQLSSYISDYEEIKLLRNEVELNMNPVLECEKEINLCCNQRHWVQAENIVRNFLTKYPMPNMKLGEYVSNISEGVVRYENKLRFLLFSIIGGVLFLLFSYQIYDNFESDQKVGIVLASCFECVLSFGCFLILFQILFMFAGKRSERYNGMSLFSVLLCGIFVAVVLSCCGIALEYLPNIVANTEKNLQEEGKQLIDVPPLYYGINYIFPIVVRAFALGWFQFYLYLFFQYCINKKVHRFSIHLLWVCIVQSLGFFLIHHQSIQTSLGSLADFLVTPLVILSLIWIPTCLLAWIDNKENLDTSFGLSDFFKDYLYRKFLLQRLKSNEFGKNSLLDTDWYQECERLQQQKAAQHQRAVHQQRTAQITQPPTQRIPPQPPPYPKTNSIPVPIQKPAQPPNPQHVPKVHVPPLRNSSEQKR
ncbi:MAG: hypothetical protein LBE12_09385 [Planctomycetaceae bacterium]|jgi:tetratricopeptide (TPR) repeat protein|nr:hypothetical protein [Planctomycetaceae bacterium]